MRHIIRLNAGKEIKSFSELFIDKIFEYTFVTFECEQTIGFRCKYRGCQVLAGVVTGVNKPSIKFWVDIVRGETRLRPQFLARN